ncbi:hypothetical protein [Saccharopolyspora pogona]|uniref:hypothetical protein n=1 Tax=Saccharopolyspora pogona TaxID=333966 RepID=UPI0016843D54|nr:hypothetical protein [Saccharopolyspora pogona]
MARTALERAWRTMDQLGEDDPYGCFDPDRLAGFDGLCALYSGNAAEVHQQLARSKATLTKSRDAVQRGILNADAALARLRLGDHIHDALLGS